MEQSIRQTSVKGWGVDLDAAQRPAVPMEHTPPGGTGAHWEQPEPQFSGIRVFQSIERPAMTHVYGTSAPPRGISGRMRAYAYEFGEARLARWMTLLAADRVDVIEGLVDDLQRGKIPNIFAEMGLGAEWKYNKKALVRRALVGASAVAAGAFIVSSARKIARII